MIEFKTTERTLLADTLTPVSIYLKLRDKYANSFLLESSDNRGGENSFSYVCCDPIASFKAKGADLFVKYPNQLTETKTEISDVMADLHAFKSKFKTNQHSNGHIQNGLFGYMSYQSVEYVEDIDLQNKTSDIPDICYSVFKYVIAIDHFKNKMHVYEHLVADQPSNMDSFVGLISDAGFPSYSFNLKTEEQSNFTDNEFMEVVQKCIEHCQRGDVFQIVPSRRFENTFSGDDFNVYRALRSINPSPYLFYYDFGSFKIFGSSPEAQIVIKNQVASIHPIAGTFKRTGNDAADQQLAEELMVDEKENAEHVMLVDLARNDLSVNSEKVKVEVFKEIQYFSHVIHLVSKVTGQLRNGTNPLKLVGDTFPAGTLTGAPKHMAMQLIDRYENIPRSYYGGAIGFMGFNDEFNHAIMIRSFLVKGNKIMYQAGAGVVSKSVPANELNEVNNKLLALRKALKEAELI